MLQDDRRLEPCRGLAHCIAATAANAVRIDVLMHTYLAEKVPTEDDLRAAGVVERRRREWE
jgi:hypothetical protein